MPDHYRCTIELRVEDTGAWSVRVDGATRIVLREDALDRAAIAAQLVATVAGVVAGWVRRVGELDREHEAAADPRPDMSDPEVGRAFNAITALGLGLVFSRRARLAQVVVDYAREHRLALETVVCRECGAKRRGVSVENFVCRCCLGMTGEVAGG